jgi:hypothetical protein
VAARAEQSNSGSEEEYIDEEGRRIVGGIGSQLVYIGQVRLLLCSPQPEKTETNGLIADVNVGALDVCVFVVLAVVNRAAGSGPRLRTTQSLAKSWAG